MRLPDSAAAEPWVVGRSPNPSPSSAVTIPAVAPLSMTGLAVRPSLNRAVATCRYTAKKGGAAGTRVVYCDTAAGKVLNEWQMAGDFAVLDLSPDGRAILATAPNPGRGRETLRVWLITSGGKLKRWSFEPHELPLAGPPANESGRQLGEYEAAYVRWASFVGNERIVSMSWAGQLRVWDPDGPKLLATIDTTQCRPAITPDGTRVAFLAGESVALLDPTAGRITDVRRIGPAPPYPVLAFNPEGTKLAIGGNGEVLILELSGGSVQHAPLPKLRVTDNGIYDRSFAWAGKGYLYADQQLYDPSFPLPVWEYRGAEQMQVRGWQMWMSICTPKLNTSTIRAFTLPHIDPRSQISSARSNAGQFALKPGDHIRIDVSGVPADRQAEVKAALEKRLKEIGYVPDGNGSATLLATVDIVGIKSSVTYVAREPVPFVRHPAKLQLVLNGKELWSEGWSTPPPLFPQPLPNEPMQVCLERCGAGSPNYDLFKIAAIPAYFPIPTAPAVALGSSRLTAEGGLDN